MCPCPPQRAGQEAAGRGLEARPHGQQPVCTKKAPAAGRLWNLRPPAPPSIPEAPDGPAPSPGRSRGQRREATLSNASRHLFFFLILFKLKPSKVVPDKSEGCRGSGLSFLLLATSAKDNTGLWLNSQARQVPTGLREALSTCRGLPASQPAS